MSCPSSMKRGYSNQAKWSHFVSHNVGMLTRKLLYRNVGLVATACSSLFVVWCLLGRWQIFVDVCGSRHKLIWLQCELCELILLLSEIILKLAVFYNCLYKLSKLTLLIYQCVVVVAEIDISEMDIWIESQM